MPCLGLNLGRTLIRNLYHKKKTVCEPDHTGAGRAGFAAGGSEGEGDPMGKTQILEFRALLYRASVAGHRVATS